MADQRVTVENVPAIFIELQEARKFQGDPDSVGRWSITLLFNKESKEAMDQFDMVQKRGLEIVRERLPKITKERYAAIEKPWKDGAGVDPEKYPPAYLNSYVLSAHRSETHKLGAPYLCEPHDPSVQIPNEKANSRFPDGTIVACSIDLYFIDRFGPRLCAGLVAVQYLKKGEPMGAGAFVPTNYFRPHKPDPLESALPKEDTEKENDLDIDGW